MGVKAQDDEDNDFSYTDEYFLRLSAKLWYGVLCLVCAICYFNSLSCDLVHDDIFAVKTNQDLQTNTPISNVFYNDFWGRSLQDERSHKSYRPLLTLTFKLNYLFHGVEPFGYHLTNVIIHMSVSCLFFYMCLTILLKNLQMSAMASVLFASHPVHVEAVTGVVGRGDVLSCLFFLVTLLLYIKYLDHIETGDYSKFPLFESKYHSFLLAGTLGIFIKEHAVTVFGVCLAYDAIRNKEDIFNFLESIISKSKAAPQRFGSFFRRALVLVMYVSSLLLFRMWLTGPLPRFQHEDNPASFSNSLMTRLLTYSYLFAFNAKLLIAPIVLCYDWQVGSIPLVETLLDFRNLETLFFYMCLFSLVLVPLIYMKDDDSSQDIIWIGVALLVIPFLPASNLFLRVGFVVAERILYIPSLGYCILIAYGFGRLQGYVSSQMKSPPLTSVLYVLYGIVILMYSCKTVSYNRVWQSRETLFTSGVTTLPHNAKAHYNMANLYKDRNDIKKAIHHYTVALELYPIHASSRNNLASLLITDNPKEAEKHLIEVLKNTPTHFRAMVNMANILRMRQEFEQAKEFLLRALSYQADYFDARYLLAATYADLKMVKEADTLYGRLVSDNSGNTELLMNYGKFLLEAGLNDKALDIYKSVLKVNPNHAGAMLGMGVVYKNIGKYEKAQNMYTRAINTDPSNSNHYQALAFLHWIQNKKEEAAATYKLMMEKTNPTQDHMRNYAVVLLELKRQKDAVSVLKRLCKSYPTYALGHQTLINTLHSMGATQEALDAIAVAEKSVPGNVDILLQKGTLYRELKKYNEAKRIFKTILLSIPDNADAHMSLGSIYHIQNQLPEARFHYEQAQKLSHGSDDLLKQNIMKLERLERKARKT